MKRLIFAGLLAVVLITGSNLGQTSETGTVDIIVRRPGGIPIEGVYVTLTHEPYSSYERRIVGGNGEIVQVDRVPGAQTVLSSTSDRSGHAIFRNLAKGFYKIHATRDGFVSVSGSRITTYIGDIPMSPDQSAYARAHPNERDDWHHPMSQQVNLRMNPGSVISGRVHDSRGNPATGVRIAALTLKYQESGQAFLVEAQSAQTDDRGSFRIFRLPAGEYYLRIGRSIADASGRPMASRLPYYYPGTTDAGTAKPVVLRDDDEVSDIDFTAAAPSHTVSISGVVRNLIPGGIRQRDGRLDRYISVFLLQPHTGLTERAAYFSNFVSRANSETEFPFEIQGVPPGNYELYALFRDRQSDEAFQRGDYIGSTQIEVGERNVSGVTVMIRKGADIQGRIDHTGTAPDPNEVHISTMTSAIGFMSLMEDLPAESSDIGSLTVPLEKHGFSIANVVESRYRIRWLSLRDDEYLSDMRQDGRSVYNDGVILVGTAALRLELSTTRNGGSVEGTVDLLKQDDPWAPISIVLVPDKLRRGNILLYKTTSINGGNPQYRDVLPDGRFRLDGIAPGDYKIFAWESLPEFAERNSEFLARYESRGVSVTLGSGMKLRDIHVPIISR